MSHDCPECGELCYCDWDDLFKEDIESYVECKHYIKCETEEALEGD